MLSNYSENFVKLNNTCVISQYSCIDLKKSHGNFNQQNQWKGVKYYSTVSQDSDKLWNLIPARFHKDFKLSIMTINCQIPPHTDSGILCSINAYIIPCDSVTKFYTVNDVAITRKLESQTNGSIFDKSCLTYSSEFTALPNEVYLLDVTVPHEVESNNKEISVDRIAMCLQSQTRSFHETYRMLQETNNLL
jgi:hypothetical protein